MALILGWWWGTDCSVVQSGLKLMILLLLPPE